MKEMFSPIANSNNGITIFKNKNKKRLFLGLFASVLLVATVIGIVASVASRKSSVGTINNGHEAAHAIVKSSCSSTLYPDLCFSTISALPADATSTIKTTKDVIILSLNVTESSVYQTYLKIQGLTLARRSYTPREVTALKDCLQTLSETVDEIRKVVQLLKEYPSLKNSISEHADELKILISAAMTNQETCLDGFSHDRADEKVREFFLGDERHVHRLCGNALAMIKTMTDTDMANEQALSSSPSSERRLKEENGIEWPEWLPAGDRRLLQATTLTPNVVVAADGSGNYRTVSEAVAAAPSRSSTRYIIRIKAGVYRENVDIPSSKTNLMFVGDGRTTTIITGSRSVVGGSTTFNSATVAVNADGFLARDVTFQNTAGPSGHQAVALRVSADLSAFYRCDMIAFQDTLYVHRLRQFYVSCIVIGTVDFIFGNAAVVFQNCDIHARRPNPGQRNMVTAQGREDPNQNTGIVIQKCRIGATQDLEAAKNSFQSYLGRPWKLYSRTVIMQSQISDIIHPAGWFMWDGTFALDTLTYREYQNTGPGANTANRVTWMGYKVMTSASEALPYTAGNFISGGNWLSSTGFPFSLGL
ncbi:pectinesterase [Ricinus communis]|uniref:Pectinesterase n=1 Tax=Ricinus communis TaxID=3988 RepID=B9RR17_RICCO|nr:pectinesterase [Ricinus communis]EEF46188.1 Pectinesterase-3 precursor, putative [Ricinus communis]|eukprot:XP_002516186.1 pectinesterase [Ricinus communis]